MHGMKKKYGPLPLWAWVVIVGGTIGIFLYYRSASSSSSSTANSQDQVDPNNPQGLTYAQETADEEAGIDPLTGATYASEQAALGSTDGSGSGGGGGTDSGVDPDTGEAYGAEILAALQNGTGLSDNTTPGQTFLGELRYVNAVIKEVNSIENALKPAPQNLKNAPKLTAAGAIRAPSGPTKPPAKKGFAIRGLGNGNWEYVPTGKTSKPSSGSGGVGTVSSNQTIERKVTHTNTAAQKAQQKAVKAAKSHVVSGKKKKK